MQRGQTGLSLPTILLVLSNILIPIAILTFATGFFPYKPVLPGLAQYEALDYGRCPVAPFDRLVFMVVDALRSDFVFSDATGFEFTQRLIKDGFAIPFTAHATSPTVTMPRLKAITTGSIPSFLDVILNINEGDSSSSLAAQDTWLAQMKAKRKGKLVMYGDDTWLKLFPNTFDRADGTSSFFVSDFTIVDNNVTRHIATELRQDDWSTMVLHYLGLDHIGHKGGPRSPYMIPKQREMDDIVQQIYKALDREPHLASTLLVICGDHGMNDAGNHGASSAGETSPAMVFVSPKLKSISKPKRAPLPYADDFEYYSLVEQSDLAPTLGALLGFPVPKNNLGALIMDFLPFWTDREQQMTILMLNAKQIFNVITAAFGESLLVDTHEQQDCTKLSHAVKRLACEWHNLDRTARADKPHDLDYDSLNLQIYQWLQRAQKLMTSMASNYDIPRLALGGAAALFSLGFAVVAMIISAQRLTISLVPFVGMILLYGIMMFASSYVEEEHHFWYWSTSAWLLYLIRRRLRNINLTSAVEAFFVFLSVRLMRGWNQTGQKFAGNPDIVKTFISANPPLLWCLILLAYTMVATGLIRGLGSVSFPFVACIVGSALLFKITFTSADAPELVVGPVETLVKLLDPSSLVTQARMVFLALLMASLYVICYLIPLQRGVTRQKSMRTLHYLYTLLALTQSRATNIPLFILFHVLLWFLEQVSLDYVEITITSLLLQFATFFALGGTNAISSVDLSSAYNGVSDFNVVAVGILTFISNWAGPIWWTSATNLLLNRNHAKASGNAFKSQAALLTVFTTAALGFVMAACTALRTHLFIWTVFSPKYLYSMAWSLGQHLIINLGLGGLLYQLGLTATGDRA